LKLARLISLAGKLDCIFKAEIIVEDIFG